MAIEEPKTLLQAKASPHLKILHNVFPISVRSRTGPMEGFKHFIIGPMGRMSSSRHFSILSLVAKAFNVLCSPEPSLTILKKNVCNFHRQLFPGLALGGYAKLGGGFSKLCFSCNRHVKYSFPGRFQCQHYFAAPCSMGCNTCRPAFIRSS